MTNLQDLLHHLDHQEFLDLGLTDLDLDYQEDSSCDTDMNVVMTESGDFVEIQGTAEGGAFSHAMLGEMLGMAQKGIGELIHMQKRVLGLEEY